VSTPRKAVVKSSTGSDAETAEGQRLASLIKRGVAWKFISQAFAQLWRIAFALFLARLLSPDDYGIAGMALVAGTFVLVFGDLGLGAALIQREAITEADRSTTFWLSLGSGVIATAATLAVAAPLARFFDEPAVEGLVSVLAFSFLITSLGATQRALLTREMNFNAIELRVMVGTLISGIVAVVLAALGYGPWAIVGQYMTMAAISTTMLVVAARWWPRAAPSMTSVRNLAGLSLGVLGNRILYTLEDAATNTLIGRSLGPAALGAWTVSTNVVLIPVSRLTVPIGEVLFPAFSRIQDDRDRIGVMWLTAIRYGAAISTPALLGLAAVTPDFVPVVLGDRWAATEPVLQVLALIGTIRAIQGWNTSVVVALNRARSLAILSAGSLLAAIASISIGTQFGVVWAAVIFTSCMATCVYLPYQLFLCRLLGVPVRDLVRALGGVVVASLIMAAVVVLARHGLRAGGIARPVRLGVEILLGSVVYILALTVLARDVVLTVRDRLGRARGRTTDPHASSPELDETGEDGGASGEGTPPGRIAHVASVRRRVVSRRSPRRVREAPPESGPPEPGAELPPAPWRQPDRGRDQQ
jgi:O-antigen/teichoic acid export membrane protein